MGWLTGWEYRRELTVTEQSGSDLTDFQVLIILDSTNFDFLKANADGSDIRFTTDDGTTLLDHWIEYWDNVNAKARIWIKIPSILANGSVTVYMYYGNSSATDTSDASLVFDYWEDFTSGFPADWKVSAGSWSGEAPTYIKTTGLSGNRAYYEGASYAPPIVIESMEKPASDTKGNTNILMGFQSDGNNYRIVANSSRDVLRIVKAVSGTSTVLATYDYAVNSVWFFTSVRWDSSGNITASFYLADTYQKITDISATDTTYTSGYIGLGGYSKGNLKDWIRVRKYASDEPSYSVGTEETQTVVETILITDLITVDDLVFNGVNAIVDDSLSMLDSKQDKATALSLDSLSLVEANRDYVVDYKLDSINVTSTVRSSISAGLLDAFSMADNGAGDTTASLNDSIVLADSSRGSLYAVQHMLDVISLSDISRLFGHSVTRDIVTLTTLLQASTNVKLSDVITLDEAIDAVEQILRQTISLIDTLDISDDVRVDAKNKLYDLLSLYETLRANIATLRTDSISLEEVLDIVEKYGISHQQLSDTITTVDNLVVDVVAMYASSIALSDHLQAKPSLQVTDTLTLTSDLAIKLAIITVENLRISETLTMAPYTVLKDIIPLLESIDTIGRELRTTIADIVELSENINVSTGVWLADIIYLTDDIQLLSTVFAYYMLSLYSRIITLLTLESIVDIIHEHESRVMTIITEASEVIDEIELESDMKKLEEDEFEY